MSVRMRPRIAGDNIAVGCATIRSLELRNEGYPVIVREQAALSLTFGAEKGGRGILCIGRQRSTRKAYAAVFFRCAQRAFIAFEIRARASALIWRRPLRPLAAVVRPPVPTPSRAEIAWSMRSRSCFSSFTSD